MLHCLGETGRCPGPGFSQTGRPGSWRSRVWRAAEEEEEDEELVLINELLQRL